MRYVDLSNRKNIMVFNGRISTENSYTIDKKTFKHCLVFNDAEMKKNMSHDLNYRTYYGSLNIYIFSEWAEEQFGQLMSFNCFRRTRNKRYRYYSRCIPAPGIIYRIGELDKVLRLYFRTKEDAMLFKMTWG